MERRGMSLQEEVRGLNEAFGKVVSNQDVDGLVELYTPDAKLLPPGLPMLEGTEAIRGFFRVMLDAGVRELELKSVVVDGTG
jgi:ketosteroid isomerase-like protein